ncbi:uncharacterized protein LOC143775626 [Ranitomeya variabilis]|uniref:uncharacterized protein LOC143775626 n=1 Tax=Ranitomeya variabilis TaxID=490064 RepID=UPI0040577AE6
MAMWNFYYRHTKQKADKWQNMCFRRSNASCSSLTINCVWLQCLLIFLFCLDCSGFPTESPISGPKSSVESSHAKSYIQVPKKISQVPEMQNSVTQMPVWEPKVLKTGLKALNAVSMLEQQTILVSSHRRYKQRRLFKREAKNHASSPELTATFTEMPRIILDGETLYHVRELENIESVASSNSRSLSSFPGKLLRNGLLNDNSLDNLLTMQSLGHSDLWEMQTPSPKSSPVPWMQTSTSEMHSFLDGKTSSAVQQGHMLSSLKLTTFAKSEDVSSISSLNQGRAAVTDLKLFLTQPENILTSAQGFHFGKGNLISKLRNYTDLPGSLLLITDKTKVLIENDSNETTMTSSGYTNNGIDKLPDSAMKTTHWYNVIPKPATVRFNLFDTSVPQKTSTLRNMVTPNLKSTGIGLVYSDGTVTRTSLTNIASSSSMMSGKTKLYSQNSKPSLSPLFFDFLDVHTSFYRSTDDFVSVSSPTKRNIDIKTSLNKEIISHATKQSMGSSPSIESSPSMSTPLGIFFAASNFPGYIKKVATSIAPTLHTSKTDQTSKHDKSLDQTRGTLFGSTFPFKTTMTTARMSRSFTWKTTNQVDFSTFSSVTPSNFQLNDEACVLQINDPTNTETPKSSETLSLSPVYESPVYKSDTTVLSTSNAVTPVDGIGLPTVYKWPVYKSDTTVLSTSNAVMPVNGSHLPTVYKSPVYESDTTVSSTSISVTPVDGTTLLEGAFTEESSQVGNQSSVTPFQNNVFNDALNGNGKINQSTLNTTSTLSSTMSSVTSLWKTGTSQLFNSTVQDALPKTTLSKSLADPMASTIKYTFAISTKNLVSKIISTSPGQPRAVTATYTNKYPKHHNVTGPLFTTSKKVQTASTTLSWLASLSSKTTLANATLTIKDPPAPKEWIPEMVVTLKSTTATIIKSDAGEKVSETPATNKSVVYMPLNFHLNGVSFSEQLTNHTSDEYRKLERQVKLVMDKMFSSKYQDDYLDTEIKAFLKGSVIVMSNVAFHSVPSVSDIIRTVLTDGTKTNYFGWSINGSTVELNGYTRSNLEVETLPISFLVLRAGHIVVSGKNQEKQNFLDSLQKAVFQAANKSFPISNVSISQIRDVHGDLAVRGSLYLNSTIHTNVQSLISSLLPLVNRSVDLSSIIVNGIRNKLQVHSINFRVTNKQFVLNLLDMSSSESQLLSKDLAAVIESVLHDSTPLQAIMREFGSGSVVCKGDLLYLFPAPGSEEVLKLLLKNLGSDGSLGSSTYKVDFTSIIVGDSSPGPAYEYIDFPGFGVAIIVMCGLCILIFPIVLFVCIKTRILGRRQKATIQRRPDFDNQSHHFEMDNRAFRESIEQP